MAADDTEAFYYTGTDANGCPVKACPVLIKVTPPIEVGTIAADQLVCAGDDPAELTELTAPGGAGTAMGFQWVSSTTSTTAGFSDIGGAVGTTYDPPAGITETTYYGRIHTRDVDGVLCSDTSNIVTVTVIPLPTPADAPFTICADETSTDLTANDATVLDGDAGTVAWYDGDPAGAGTLIDPATAVNLNTVTDLFARVTTTVGSCTADVDVTVNINPLPTPADAPFTICVDETATDLTANDATVLDGDAGTVAWYDGDPATTGTLISPATAVNLNTVTDLFARVTTTVGSCTADVDVTVNITPLPTPVDAPFTICADETSTDLTANDATVLDGDAGTVAWYDGDPAATGTLIDPATAVNLNGVTDLFARVTTTVGSCTADVDVTVNITPLPTPVDAPFTICADETSTDLTANDATVLDGDAGTVAWYDGDPATGTLIDPATAVNLTGVTDLFARVTTTVGSCTADVDVTVNITPLPTPVDAPFTICADETSTDLTANDATVLDGDAGTVAWYDGDPATGTLIDPATAVNLNTVTDLFARVTTTVGSCTADVDVTVNITPLPTPVDAPFTICADETSTDLTANDATVLDGDAGTVAWYDGDPATGTLIDPATAVNLNTVTDLFARVTTTVGSCTADVDVTVNITPLPTPVDAPFTICADETSTDLTANDATVLDGDAGTVAWYDGDPATGTLIDPATAVDLTGVTDLFARVTTTVGSCTADVDVTVNITPLPTPADAPFTICADETSTDLTANDATVLDDDAGTVAWYDGDPAAAGTLISPATAVNLNTVTDLFARVTTTVGSCTADVDVTVNITPLPTPVDAPFTICADETSTDLTANDATVLDGDAGTVAWYDGDPATGTLIDPATAVDLTGVTDLFARVTTTVGSCTADVDVTVTINPLPTPVDAPFTICADETSTDLTANDATVLDGDAGTVAWYDGDPAAAGTLISPATAVNLNTVTDLFARVTTTVGSCTADVDVTVNITPLPTPVDAPFTICADETSTDLTANDATVLDGDAGTVAWYDGDPATGTLIDPATAVDLTGVTDLFAHVTTTVGSCTADVDVTVTINPLPTPVDAPFTICADETSTDLTANDATVLDGDAGTVAWYDGDPAAAGTLISPATAVNLNTVTDLFARVTTTVGSCTADVDVTVNITPLPTPVDAPFTICADETSTDLTANDATVLDGDAGTVAWYDGDPAAAGTLISPATAVNLNTVTDLFARVTTTVGSCTADVDVTVNITPLPTPVDAPFTICADETSTDLTANDATVLDGDAGTVAWYDGDPATGTLIDPATAVDLTGVTDLFARVTTTVGSCTADVDVTVTINPLPTPVDAPFTICADETSTDLTANDATVLDGDAGTVAWYDGDPATGTLIDPATAVDLTGVTDLFAHVTTTVGSCTADVDVTVNITPLPTPVDAPFTICADETSTDLTANDATVLDGDAGTVAWYDGDPAAAGTLISPATAVNLNTVTDLFAHVTTTVGSCTADVDVTVTINALPTVSVAMPFTICSSRSIDLTQDASIAPVSLGGTWSTPDGTGAFTTGMDFAAATTYVPSPEDALRGSVTFVLTTNDPAGPCEPVSAQVVVEILKFDCGTFPWSGER